MAETTSTLILSKRACSFGPMRTSPPMITIEIRLAISAYSMAGAGFILYEMRDKRLHGVWSLTLDGPKSGHGSQPVNTPNKVVVFRDFILGDGMTASIRPCGLVLLWSTSAASCSLPQIK